MNVVILFHFDGQIYAITTINNDPMGVPDVDSRSAEEMADSMLWDSPLPETEEEWKQAKDIPTGEFTIPLPANLEFLPFVRHFNNFLLGPLNQEDPLLLREVPRRQWT